MKKLSELDNNDFVIEEDSGIVVTVEGLKDILNDNKVALKKYYTTKTTRLEFDAREMIENFLNNFEESGEGYEDMADVCMKDIEEKDIKEIQNILDKISTSSDNFLVYWKDEEINLNE